MGWKREEELKRQTAVKVIAGLWFGLTLILLYLNMGGSSFTASGTSEFYSRPPDDIQLIKCSTSAIDWTVHRPESITLPHVIEYVEWTNSSSCRLSHDFGGHIHDLGVDGQKAVCMDPEVRPESGKCLVYSFGIAHDWTFDEAIEEFGCEVFAFDPTTGEKDHDHSPKIHFRNLGLGGRNEVWDGSPTRFNWTIRTLDTIYRQLGHEGRIIDYLKIDIEHSEWVALPQILSSGMMDRVRQLAVEIHLPEQGELEEFRRRVAVLKSLEDYGLVRFDSKYNPWSLEWNVEVDYEGFMAYELAWWNSKLRRPSDPTSPIQSKPVHKKHGQTTDTRNDKKKVFKS